MIAVPARHDAGLLGIAGEQMILPRELDRSLVGGRAGRRHPDLGESLRRKLEQLGREVDGGLAGECAGMGKAHPTGLRHQRLDDVLIAVPEIGDEYAAGAIDVALPAMS
jgi:hypothetical protein